MECLGCLVCFGFVFLSFFIKQIESNRTKPNQMKPIQNKNQVWNSRTGALLHTVKNAHSQSVSALIPHPFDPTSLASISTDGAITTWRDVGVGQREGNGNNSGGSGGSNSNSPFPPSSSSPSSFSSSPSSSSSSSSSPLSCCRRASQFHNVLTAGPQSEQTHHGMAVNVLDGVFSPDGCSLAVADNVSGVGRGGEGGGRGSIGETINEN